MLNRQEFRAAAASERGRRHRELRGEKEESAGPRREFFNYLEDRVSQSASIRAGSRAVLVELAVRREGWE